MRLGKARFLDTRVRWSTRADVSPFLDLVFTTFVNKIEYVFRLMECFATLRVILLTKVVIILWEDQT